MTHTIHRQALTDQLDGDFVLLCTPAKGINSRDCLPKLQRVFDLLVAAGLANIGFYEQRSGRQLVDVRDQLDENTRLRCCFDDETKLKEVLAQLESEDLGLSICVSGPLQQVLAISGELGLKPHTANISCGVFGRVERLPDPQVLELSTMCGHGLISHELVTSVIAQLGSGALQIDQAVERLSVPCSCGIFNPTRARRLLLSNVSNNACVFGDERSGARTGQRDYIGK